MAWSKRPPKPPLPDHYFEITLDPDLMLAMGDLLEGRKVPGVAVERLKTAWLFGRKVKLPFKRLDWSTIELSAKQQGCSEADIIFDLARGKEPQ